MQPREYNKNAKYIGNMTKEREGPKEGLTAEIHRDLRSTSIEKFTKLENTKP